MISNRRPTGSIADSLSDKNKFTRNKQLCSLIVSISSINKTGSNPPSDFSDNENKLRTATHVWSKHLKSSSTPPSPLPEKDTNILISSNRFSPLAPTNEGIQMVTDNLEQAQEVTVPKTINPLPIFIEFNLNLIKFAAKIKELTQHVGFECKSSTKRVKLQIFNSNSYRSVVKFRTHSKIKKLNHTKLC